MTKQEVQQRVLQNGKPLDLDKFNWDEKTNTFSSNENGLVLDFKGIDNCTFNTGPYCTFNTGPYCTFNTGYNCTFNTGFYCTFDTGDYCTFNTGSYCTFDTGSDCTFKTGNNCTFKTGYDCTFNTYFHCTFNTGKQCVVVRRDIYEVIELLADKTIKLNGCGEKGYAIVEDEEMLEIDGKKFSKSTIKEALKNYLN